MAGDDFDVVYGQYAVKGDRDQCPQLACDTPFVMKSGILFCLTIFILTKLYYNIPCLERINIKPAGVAVHTPAENVENGRIWGNGPVYQALY